MLYVTYQKFIYVFYIIQVVYEILQAKIILTLLLKNEIIDIHLNTDFYVYMIGFMPGLPFMGNLDKTILIPRKLSPRVEVPSGSVAIVDNLCVIYPNISPGGWNIIGRTPQIMFNKNSHNPNLLRAGFKVKFKKISKKQFTEFAKKNEL